MISYSWAVFIMHITTHHLPTTFPSTTLFFKLNLSFYYHQNCLYYRNLHIKPLQITKDRARNVCSITGLPTNLRTIKSYLRYRLRTFAVDAKSQLFWLRLFQISEWCSDRVGFCHPRSAFCNFFVNLPNPISFNRQWHLEGMIRFLLNVDEKDAKRKESTVG